jgi:hypothetical protein
MRGGVAFARGRPPLAPQTGADEMMVRKKALEIFVGLSYIVHRPQSPLGMAESY